MLSSVDQETGLVRFVRDAVLYFRSKHHLRALHEIVHYIFKFRHASIFIDQVEVYLLVGSNLDPYVATDEKYLTSVLHFVVLIPFACFFIYLEK